MWVVIVFCHRWGAWGAGGSTTIWMVLARGESGFCRERGGGVKLWMRAFLYKAFRVIGGVLRCVLLFLLLLCSQ